MQANIYTVIRDNAELLMKLYNKDAFLCIRYMRAYDCYKRLREKGVPKECAIQRTTEMYKVSRTTLYRVRVTMKREICI